MNPRWVDRIGPALLVVVGVIVVAVLTVFGGPVFHSTGSKRHPYMPPPPPIQHNGNYPGLSLSKNTVAIPIVIFAILGAILLIVAVIAAFKLEIIQRSTWFRRPADTVVDRPPGSIAEQVLAAVDAGLVELDLDGSDPRSAVIECWVRLEKAAFLAGVERRIDGTSSELVAQLLRHQRVSATTLQHFAELYRTARYSTQAVEESMRDDARESFRQLRRELLMSLGAAT
ncbi:MAG TPA: DUF4129 domain-containing protein [Micromonosporaceae bacterium]|jgi:hypothetical protein